MKTAGLSMISLAGVFVWVQPTNMNIVNVTLAGMGLTFLALGSMKREGR